MAVRIRLTRLGAKKKPFYRIVVTNSTSPRDGGYIEAIGTYDPLSDPVKVTIDREKLSSWLDKGATATDTVKGILKNAEEKGKGTVAT
jgi:small subunit ribosomal protein S16